MAEHFPNHKLTAIFYADVAGYSRLTSQNEMGTHKRVMETLDFASEAIKEGRGTVLRYAGDAILAEFTSALKLVQTAVDIQREIESRNTEFPAEDKVQIRIGLNIGEVLQDRGEIFGDGVNLAARLEAAAKPGGICISAAVHEQIVGKLEIEFADGGMEAFKNIPNPVHVYHWGPGIETTNVPWAIKTPAKSSIAVLAFENMSGDPEQDYFCDGITEDIITELSHFKDISVTARNSSFAFRGQSVDIIEIGQKLNVHYVLEGSIRKSGQRVRVTAQLIDATTGTHVWADRYDRDLEDVFEVQDEVVKVIASTLIGKLRHADHELAKRKMPSSLAAYDCVVLGLNHFYKWTPDNNKKALELFKQAISIDPEYACAYAWLAQAYFRDGLNMWSASYEHSFSLLYDYAVKAVTLDDNDSLTHTALGIAHLFRREHDLARSHFERALILNPSNTDAMVHLARWEALTGNPDKGIERLTEALQYNPLANYQWFVGQIEFIAERYDDAVDALNSLSSPNALVHAFLAASYGQLGNIPEAEKAASLFITKATELLDASGTTEPDSWIDFVIARYPFQYEDDAERLKAGLANAGIL
ncbi:tetratricopeptide repeat protein [Gammaproteobacteria bacterium]|nr:tetratricopeptide repeat protein [Gammaproteobacteria bacterium]